VSTVDEAVAVSPGEDIPEPETPRARSPILWTVCALLMVPFVVLAIRAFLSRYLSTSDMALIELRTRDVGSGHTPLVGVYSRYGWNHPGPLLFYVLALPYRLFGSSARALLLGGTLINAAALIGCAWIFWRRGRVVGLGIGLVLTMILIRTLSGSFLWFPWNPFIIVLPILLLALLAWSVACGDHWCLPFAVGVASFAVQSHVGAAAPALALLVVAVAALVYDAVRHRVAELGWLVFASIAVALFSWVPPLIQQFQPNGGNLGSLWDFWTASHKTPGLSDGVRIVAPQLSLPAPWITGHERVEFFTASLDPKWQVPFVLLLLVGAAVIAWRRRDRQSLTIVGIALVLAASAMFAAASVVDSPYSYLLRWTYNVGVISWLAIAWTIWRAVPAERWHRIARPLAVVAIVVCAALLVATTVGAVHADHPDREAERESLHMDAALTAATKQLPQPVVVRSAGGLAAGALAASTLMRLVHLGVRAGFTSGNEYVAGGHVYDASQAQVALTAVTDEDLPAYMNDPRFHVVAQYDSLSPAQRAYIDNFDAKLKSLDSNLARYVYIKAHAAEFEKRQNLGRGQIRSAIFSSAPNDTR
jgi:hypothetical protein